MTPHIEFTVTITKGIMGTVAILEIEEKWIANDSKCEWIAMDIDFCFHVDWCEQFDKFEEMKGTFKISGKAVCDEDAIDEYTDIQYQQIKAD